MGQRRFVQEPIGQAVREVVAWELFDTKPFLNDGTTNALTFFLNPSALGPLYTNMHVSGQLSNPDKMDVYGVAIEIFPDFDQNRALGIGELWASEKKKIREGCWIEFWVGTKTYLILPLLRIPEGMGATGITAGADTDTGSLHEMLLTHGLQDVKHYYPVGVPIKGILDPVEIPSQQGFRVVLQWPNPPNLSATGQSGLDVLIRVFLIGNLWRSVQ